MHPGLIDGCFQLLAAAVGDDEAGSEAYVPVGIDRLTFYRRPKTELWCYVRLDQKEKGSRDILSGRVQLFEDGVGLIAEMEGFYLKRASKDALFRSSIAVDDRGNLEPFNVPGFGRIDPDRLTDWLYEVSWQPKPLERGMAADESTWVIFMDRFGAGRVLAEKLAGSKQRPVLVTAGTGFKMVEEGRYEIDPTAPEDYSRLFKQAFGTEDSPGYKCVHLWSLDDIPVGTAGIREVEKAQDLGCRSVLCLTQALAASDVGEPEGIWLVTRGMQRTGREENPNSVAHAPIWGLGRTLGLELPELPCVAVDLDPAVAPGEQEWLWEEIFAPDGEDQVSFRAGERLVARLRRSRIEDRSEKEGLEVPANQPYQLDTTKRGVMENLTLRPASRREPGPGEVEIRVHATGLNFRDVLNVLGMYPGEAGPPGSECSGEITAVGEGVADFKVGDPVLALAEGCFSNYTTTRAEMAAALPEGMTFEEGATIPIVFLTAYYCLHQLAGMKAGDKVLIHAAAGGVGLAAVQLAQKAGAEVYATAGSDEKREFLKSLGVKNVMNSRTLDFAEEILESTKGRGIDIVLNSLSGDFISKSFSCLSTGGCFLEIGKIGIWDEAKVSALKKNVRYHVFYLGEAMDKQPEVIRSMLKGLVGDFAAGRLRPMPRRDFAIQEAEQAFRFMAQAKHIGKIILTHPQNGLSGEKNIRSDASYLITGGLGGLGLQVAEWMVDQGARHLVLMGRGKPSDKAGKIIERLKEKGAEIKDIQCDISQKAQVSRMIREVDRTMPGLRGIVHSAGVIDDGILLQQDWSRFKKVMSPKLKGAWNLHRQTQGRDLDFFVLFSSLASVMGSPGQSNYAAANAFLDALAHHRRAMGLPGLSINWGPWSEVGMAAALSEADRKRHLRSGINFIEPEKGIKALESLIWSAHIQVGVLSVDWMRFFKDMESGSIPNLLLDIEKGLRKQKQQSVSRRGEFLRTLRETAPSERIEVLSAHISREVIKALGLSGEVVIDADQGFSEMGLDSLMAVEISNRLQDSMKLFAFIDDRVRISKCGRFI